MQMSQSIAPEYRNRASPGLYSWVVWFTGTLFYFYEFFIQVAPNVMMPDLTRHFEITAAQFGYLATFYYAGYALMQIPAGTLLDRFGARRLIVVATLICAVGSFLTAHANAWFLVELARFATGIGSAFAALGSLVLAAKWFPTHRFGLLSGFVLTIGMLGAVAGQHPMAVMVENLGWRESLDILAIVGVLYALLTWCVISDHKNPLNKHRVDSTQSFKELLSNVATIVRQRQPWLIAFYGLLMFTPTLTLGASWGAGFLMAAYDFPMTTAGSMISFIFIGWAIGCPLFGMISDRIRLRKPPLYIASIGGTICLFIMIYVHLPSTWALGLLMLLFGIFSGAFLSSFSIARELQPAKATGAALGFMNMVQSVGGAILPPVVGAILDLLWNGTLHDGGRVYLLHDYRYALLIMPLEMMAAGLLLFFVKETHCVEVK